jgi:predicted small lipoprotein YifL
VPFLSRLRVVASLLAVATLAVGLAGCGRRGGLEAPPDASAPVAKPGDSGSPDLGIKRPRKTPIQVPHEPFVLDPLL